MSMLLMVRSADDVRLAVEAANKFLVYRRRHFPVPREVDEVLGIWLRRELDADLPAWLWINRELGAGVQLDGSDGEDVLAPRLAATAVGIRESFSLSGLWSLCWIDGTFLEKAKTARERRNQILESLVKEGARGAGEFFPVFDATETSDSIEATLQALRAEHPSLISKTWFSDDREQGLVGPQGTR